ncbi:MAG: hypothetical protein K2Z81_00300 [Cyanobacteria bacterium]|nr:hypothetical protein [Cyanobacteriota bacterium]
MFSSETLLFCWRFLTAVDLSLAFYEYNQSRDFILIIAIIWGFFLMVQAAIFCVAVEFARLSERQQKHQSEELFRRNRIGLYLLSTGLLIPTLGVDGMMGCYSFVHDLTGHL